MSKEIQHKFYSFALLTLLLFLSALNYNLLINPSKIVSGGVSGISIIVEQVLRISPSLTVLIVDAVILIIALVASEYKMVASALYSTLIYPLFLELTSNLRGLFEVSSLDLVAISIFSGLAAGVISGFICKIEMSQGGTVLISQMISKRLKVSVSKVNVSINAIIVIVGAYIFGINNLFYAFIFLVANRKMIDKIMLGTSQKKLFQIVTSQEEDIKEYIIKSLMVGCTTMKVKSGKDNSKKTIILTSISNMEYFRLKQGVHEIDPEAFMVITDSYQVNGGK